MRVALGSDHAGFELKRLLAPEIERLGHEVVDVGANSFEAEDDYPDFAERIGNAVRAGEAERGVLVCGSGIGAGIAANKLPDVRAAVVFECYGARQSVEHDDANVLVLGARITGSEVALDVLRAFLAARFSGQERHRRRLGKIEAIERRYRGQA